MDKILNVLNKNKTIRIVATDMTNTVNTAAMTHENLSRVGTAALGRTLIFNALYNASRLKGNEKSAIQINGNGPAGGIITECDEAFNLRGYAFNPDIELPLNSIDKLDVRGYIGNEGLVIVNKDLGNGQIFSGQSKIVSGELGEDFAYYMATSEQINSAVAVGVLVAKNRSVLKAGGYIVELLPGVSEAEIDQLEKTITTMPHITKLLIDNSIEEIIEQIIGEYTIVNNREPRYFCTCTHEKATKAFAALSEEEQQKIRQEYGKIEVTCNYCSKKYEY